MSEYVIEKYSEIEKFRNERPHYFQREGNRYEVLPYTVDDKEVHVQTFYRKGQMIAKICTYYEKTGEHVQLSPQVRVPKNIFLYADVYLKEAKQNKLKSSVGTVL